MVYILWVFLIVSLGLIGVGVVHDGTPEAAKWYGSGSFLLFLVTMPLFLFWRSGKTSMSKYIMQDGTKKVAGEGEEVNEENVDKHKPISNR